MKWWGWILLGLVGGITALLLWQSRQLVQARHRLATEQERSRQLAIVGSVRQVRIDSLEALIVPVDTTDRQRLREAQQRARQSAQEAARAIASARTTSDSLAITTAALWASQRHAEASDSLASRLTLDLEATSRLLALTREVQVETAAQRDSARAEAGRWKLLATDAVSIGPQPKLGRAVETAAIGAATVGACRDGLLTLGCVAGVVVTGKRLL